MLKISILFSVLVATPTLADWDGPHKKHSFPTSFPAGHESNGQKLYISQCVHRETKVTSYVPFYSTKNHDWHIGKAGIHLENGMSFSWGGNEYDSGHCRKGEHWVYVADAEASYKWVTASKGHVPENAVKGYNGKEGHRICRVKHNGGVHPGKLIPSSKACFIGWGGREHGFETYEVLVKE